NVCSPSTREEADDLLPDADVVLGFAVRRENFSRAGRLRWIQNCTAASVTGVLFPELVESPVVVTNSRGLHADSMAEHTLGVRLARARKLHHARDARARREGLREPSWGGPPPIDQLQGATLGLVGLGAVGSAIAARARALGMTVIAVRRRPAADPAPADQQWPVARLHELLPIVDWLAIAAPRTRATQGLVGRGELS